MRDLVFFLRPDPCLGSLTKVVEKDFNIGWKNTNLTPNKRIRDTYKRK